MSIDMYGKQLTSCFILLSCWVFSVSLMYVNRFTSTFHTYLVGMATLDACRQILERLEPIRQKLHDTASLKEIASAAFFERVNLSAHGYFALDNSRCGYDWGKEKPLDHPADVPQNSWKGHPFNYFTQGCAFSEVEIDVLTGIHTTI